MEEIDRGIIGIQSVLSENPLVNDFKVTTMTFGVRCTMTGSIEK